MYRTARLNLLVKENRDELLYKDLENYLDKTDRVRQLCLIALMVLNGRLSPGTAINTTTQIETTEVSNKNGVDLVVVNKVSENDEKTFNAFEDIDISKF